MKICLNCNKEYYGKGKKFCGLSCCRTYLNKQNNPTRSSLVRLKIAKAHTKDNAKIVLKCSICNNEFIKYVSELKYSKNKFCSIICRGKWQAKHRVGVKAPNKERKIIKVCKVCVKSFKLHTSELLKSSRDFCSPDCWYTYNKKENHVNWLGGKGLDRGIGWDKIRRLVYKRDNYTCKICGCTNIKLNAHHIIPFRKFKTPEEANIMNNLITLCNKCHAQEELKLFKGNNNEIKYKKSSGTLKKIF